MKGKYILELESRRVIYQLEFERKVTVIKGNSGTGKSSMIRLVRDFLELGKDSGVRIKKNGEYPISIFTNSTNWIAELESIHNGIVFCDEDVRFLYSKAFQQKLWEADCYIVIVSRSGMFEHLPFAIGSIYELRTKQNGKNYVTQMYNIYREELWVEKADCVITEDSNSGWEMMQEIFSVDVIAAGGNSNVANCLAKKIMENSMIYVVIDGAAFGGFIEKIVRLSHIRNNVTVLAPESFEYVILHTNTFKRYLTDELEHTWEYCDTREYITWEQYYTKLLKEITEQHFGFQYSKSKINDFFLNEEFVSKVSDELNFYVLEKNISL